MPEQPRDPFTDFDTGGIPVNPLPASEVRRRGDRMRRRRAAATAFGAAAAVAVVAVGGATVARGLGGDPRPPGPAGPAGGSSASDAPPTTPSAPETTPSAPETTPSAPKSTQPAPRTTQPESTPSDPPSTPTAPEPVTTLPDDFPLTQGWPRIPTEGEYGIVGPNRKLPRLAIWTPCVELPGTVPEGAPVDRLTATWSQPTYARGREVLLFATPEEAVAYADSARAVLQGCSRPGMETPVERSDDGSWQGMIVSSADTGRRMATQVVQVVVRDNAVVVSVDGGEGFNPRTALGTQAEELAPVISALEQLLSRSS